MEKIVLVAFEQMREREDITGGYRVMNRLEKLDRENLIDIYNNPRGHGNKMKGIC